MGLFTLPEDKLAAALAAKQPQVRLEHCIDSVEGLFRKALQKDRRLLALLSGYQYSYNKTGLVQLSFDYDITITYNSSPENLGDVQVDNGGWDPKTLLGKGRPAEAVVVTGDAGAISDKLQDQIMRLNSLYEGAGGYRINTYGFDKLTEDTVCTITFPYIVEEPVLRQYQGKAGFAAQRIWKKILGRASVPQFVKPFLAFSYLTQECFYDERAIDEVRDDPHRTPSDPIPHLAYGPLVENRGICGGLAWAFKYLMDAANIECQCVSGYLKDDTSVGHMWDLVKLDGQFYHVDPAWGIKNDGVYVSGLLQPDSVMKNTHIWETDQYPQAHGLRFDYDYIEDFLAENGGEYLDDGANETYFFPDKIVD